MTIFWGVEGKVMIKFYNRKNKEYQIEKVAGNWAIKWIYGSRLVGAGLLHFLIKRRIASKLYGIYCSMSVSRKKIDKFIRDFNVDMDRFQVPQGGFKSFNEFFYRKLKKDMIKIEREDRVLISPCDGKVLAYQNIDIDMILQVKDITYSLRELIADDEIAEEYNKGTCLIFRLCPSDYHRFHFVDYGICEKTNKIKGCYYSVNPVALDKIEKLFCENKREWSIFHSKNFGDILYVEVGATFVGSIVQTYKPNEEVKRGDEKGYFKFGASTVILFFKENTVIIDDDILEQTQKGYETYVYMGEKIGVKREE